MKINKLLSMGMLMGMVLSHQVSADVGGTVYRDFPVNGTAANTYGVQDANEPNVDGVTVTITDAAGTNVVPTTPITNGSWNITTGDLATYTFPLRIEYSGIPSYLESSPAGAGSNATVQFVTTDGQTANLGLHDPQDYSQLNPDIILPMHINGDPNGGGTAETEAGLILHAYNVADGSSGLNTNLSLTGETGSTYGLAYQRETGSLFSSSFIKRHVGLESSLGSIFITTDIAGASPTVEYVDLDALLGTLGTLPARPDVPANTNTASTDAGIYGAVGKIGLGDLDISPNGDKLFAVNLNNKSLITIDIGNPAKAAGTLVAGDVTEAAIPAPVCASGTWRPFGLGVGLGKVFVGGVCDASSGVIADLHGYVYAYDMQNNAFDAGSVLDFSLGFDRSPVNVNNPQCDSWKPWSDDFADVENYEGNKYCLPQPMLTDIAIDQDNSMVLGFRDRFGDQFGHNNNRPDGVGLFQAQVNGDIYRAAFNAGSWTLESNAVAGSVTGCGANNNDGPGGGEFYCEDGIFTHPNNSVGGLGIVIGSGETLYSAMDPFNLWSGGTRWVSNTTGQENKNYEVFNTGSSGTATFGKANGLGDLEFLSEPASLEIGNRVWDDTNGNGIQDPDELGIQGVLVTLTCGGLTATSTTDVNGAWLIQDGDMTGGVNIPRNTACTISVPLTEPNNGNGITTQVSSTETGNDADPATGSFAITTGRSGQNNHTYDIGYSSTPPSTSGCTTITNIATITGVTETDTNNTNDSSSIAIQANCATATPQVDLRLVKTADKTQVLAGETLTYTLTLRNEGTADGTDIEVSDNLPTGVTHVSNNPSQGSYDSGTGVWTVGDLAIGVTVTLEIVVTIN